MRLIAITREGAPVEPVPSLSEVARQALQATREWYGVAGYRPPWIGYLALVEGECVGTCAFKTPPSSGRVEIAYFTFPPHEGRGMATEMARQLIARAELEEPEVRVFAQTLPERNASARVLEKLGFRMTSVVHHPEDGTIWEWDRAAPPVE